MFRWRTVAAVVILLVTVPPPFAQWWEGAMVRHMLGQYPLLVLAGALLAPPGRGIGRDSGQAGAIAAILIAAFCISFWTIPRWLDAAVNSYGVDLVKVTTLVLLAGIPAGWAWPRLAPLARAFVLAQLASMFGILGTIYLVAPVRLCNNYLVNEQTILGRSAIAVALGIVLAGLVVALWGRGITEPRRSRA